MNYPIKTKLSLFVCLIFCFSGFTVTQVDAETPIADFIFETIEVPGVDFFGGGCK